MGILRGFEFGRAQEIPLLEQEGWLRHQSLEWAQTGKL